LTWFTDYNEGGIARLGYANGGNPRLRPHTGSDLLARKNSEGTRSKYQPPSQGGGFANVGGGQGGGGGGGWSPGVAAQERAQKQAALQASRGAIGRPIPPVIAGGDGGDGGIGDLSLSELVKIRQGIPKNKWATDTKKRDLFNYANLIGDAYKTDDDDENNLYAKHKFDPDLNVQITGEEGGSFDPLGVRKGKQIILKKGIDSMRKRLNLDDELGATDLMKMDKKNKRSH
jgi:hypothetical protein